MDLASKRCVPCESWTPPLTQEKTQEMLKNIKGWTLKDKTINKTFEFKNFKEALNFVNKVGKIAESEGHHPDICVYYNKVILNLTTHFIKGLSENDFILAAKVDQLI